MTLPSENIYIVDDDQSFGRSLKRLLNARGVATDYFGSAQSFFDSVSPDQEGCAIVDIQMPGCDGFTLIDKMHALRYGMPVIVITGQPHTGDRDQAMKKGAIGFLQKPFSEESLLELLNKSSNGRS
jgi:two-component system, LuxR family, response regulator FixJ